MVVNVCITLRGRLFDFWAGIGGRGGGAGRWYASFQKKISRRLISRKKKPCKKIPGKVIPTMKKYLSRCIMLEKNLTPLYVRKKKPITRGLRKSSYPNKITHTALKSQMFGPLLTCIFDSKEMTLIDILILSPQYANNCSSGSIFVDSVWQKTYSGGPVICVNYLKWNQSYLHNLNTPLNITSIEDR